jgi:hypothetical protein
LLNPVFGSDVYEVRLRFASNAALTTDVFETTIIHAAGADVPSNNEFNLRNAERLVFGYLPISSVSQRVVNATYLGIGILGVTPSIPYLGEVIVGYRLQLPHAPNVPWDSFGLSSVADSVESGLVTSTSTQATYTEDFFRDRIRGGVDNFLWIDAPYTYPRKAPWVRLDNYQMPGPYTGPVAREWIVNATEVGPYYVGNE